MRVIFLPTLTEATALEARCYAYIVSTGQVADRWAEIITDQLGYGVPIAERIYPTLTQAEIDSSVEWSPPAEPTFP